MTLQSELLLERDCPVLERDYRVKQLQYEFVVGHARSARLSGMHPDQNQQVARNRLFRVEFEREVVQLLNALRDDVFGCALDGAITLWRYVGHAHTVAEAAA